MPHSIIYRWGLAAGLAFVGIPASRAQNSPSAFPQSPTVSLNWVAPESHRASTPRWYQSDGTVPAVSKGRPKGSDVRPASLESTVPQTAVTPRMPHGYRDPTHPVGPQSDSNR